MRARVLCVLLLLCAALPMVMSEEKKSDDDYDYVEWWLDMLMLAKLLYDSPAAFACAITISVTWVCCLHCCCDEEDHHHFLPSKATRYAGRGLFVGAQLSGPCRRD